MKLEPADLQAMDDGTKVAVLEALVTGVLADGKVSPQEVDRFDTIVAALPWGLDRPVFEALVKGTQQRVVAMKTGPEILDFIVGVAARIPTPDLRDKIFFTMASIMAADGDVNRIEQNVIGAFVLAFGITTERLAAIKSALVGQRVAPAPTMPGAQ
jgi:uncharacterized tellurite resistance protein B-like protein